MYRFLTVDFFFGVPALPFGSPNLQRRFRICNLSFQLGDIEAAVEIKLVFFTAANVAEQLQHVAPQIERFTSFADLPVKLFDFAPYNILLVLQHGQFLLDLIGAVGWRRGDIQRQQQLAGLSGHLLSVGFCFFLKF